jgi:hypothetical protein
VDDDGTAVLAAADRGTIVLVGHATANAVTIAAANSVGFEAGYFVMLCTTAAGVTTLTPTTSTINGNTTLTLNQGDCAEIVAGTVNYTASVARRYGQITIHQWGATGGTLADSDDWTNAVVPNFPFTITNICGKVDTGTSTFNITVNGVGTIAASDIIAATTNTCTSTFTGTRNVILTTNVLDFTQVTGATSGAPTHLTVTLSIVRR